MLKDYQGKEVKDGDFLIQDEEDMAYFWKCVEGQLVLIARWGMGLLEKYDLDEMRRTQTNFHNPELKVPIFVRDNWDRHLFRMETRRFQDLALIEEDHYLHTPLTFLEIHPEGHFVMEHEFDEETRIPRGVKIYLFGSMKLSEV